MRHPTARPRASAATLVGFALGVLFWCAAPTGRATESAEPADLNLQGELGHAVANWDACEGAKRHDKYFLGRYAHGLAVVEVRSDDGPAIARLWSKAKAGGADVAWPGGRAGVRHLDTAAFAAAAPVAKAGRLYVWLGANGWGSTVGSVVGVELAKSLCDAKTLVVYLVLKVSEPGQGIAIASVLAPEAPDGAPLLADPDRRTVQAIYADLLARWGKELRANSLAPSELTFNLLPGHFTGPRLEYVASLRWANGLDDRFSLLLLLDEAGRVQKQIDKQEGGAAGIAIQVADLVGEAPQDIIYSLTTLEGSALAVWSLATPEPTVLVQTTPVGQ